MAGGVAAESWESSRRPMPLTVPAHQLLILPLLRGRASPLPGLALLIGTILPDLAFVVGGYRLNAQSHLAYGPFLMAPLGLLLYAWSEALLLPALRRALPTGGRWPVARLCATRGVVTSSTGWAWVAVALLIGAYSHLLFDGFTHAWAWPARALYSDDVARSLQIGCSIIGSVVVLIWAHRRLHEAPECSAVPRWRGGLRVLTVATLVGTALGIAIGLALLGWPGGWRQLVLLVMSPAALGAFAGATLAALASRRV